MVSVRHFSKQYPKGSLPILKFAPEFFISVATAAHQVAGNNLNSDCCAQEQIRISHGVPILFIL